MTREVERLERAQEEPIVGGLPDVPGHRRGDAAEAGARRASAWAGRRAAGRGLPGRDDHAFRARDAGHGDVSAANNCFFCMDSHGEHAPGRAGDGGEPVASASRWLTWSRRRVGRVLPKMQALLAISRTVRGDARQLTRPMCRRPSTAARRTRTSSWPILIASGFSMYNRLVEGFRARTPPQIEPYRARAGEIAGTATARRPPRARAHRRPPDSGSAQPRLTRISSSSASTSPAGSQAGRLAGHRAGVAAHRAHGSAARPRWRPCPVASPSHVGALDEVARRRARRAPARPAPMLDRGIGPGAHPAHRPVRQGGGGRGPRWRAADRGSR